MLLFQMWGCFSFTCTVCFGPCLLPVGFTTQTDPIPDPNVCQMHWQGFEMAAVKMIKSCIPSCVFEACNTALVPLQRLDHVPFPLPVLINGVNLCIRSPV